MVFHVISAALVKVSVESVLESYVSIYENHFYKERNIGEDNALHKLKVSINDPNLALCNAVVKSAMRSYWSTKKVSWPPAETWSFKDDQPVK